jgi:mRNA interferase RelE/StbE
VGRYSVRIKKSAAKELDLIPGKKTRQKIVERIQALAVDPRPPGAEKLSNTRNKYRIRQGDYRILYEIEDDVLSLYIVKIGHRKDVYRR